MKVIPGITVRVGTVPNSTVKARQPENLAVVMPELPVAGFALRTSIIPVRRTGCKFSGPEQPKSKFWEFLVIMASAHIGILLR